MGMLDGKVAIVTGAGRGLGREEALAMANEGCNLVINDLGANYDGTVIGIETKVADEVVDECRKLGVKAVANYDSVTDFNKAKGMIDQAIAEFGKLDILINNAGIGGGWSEITELNMKAFREVYDVNVFGAAMMGSKAAKLFKEQNNGNIVNIASTAALKGFSNGTVYASSKFALRGMTQCWQADLRKYNVRVILINPSEVTTAFGTQNKNIKSPCDYAVYGLFRIGHRVKLDNGEETFTFPFVDKK